MSVIAFEEALFDNCSHTIKHISKLKTSILYSEMYRLKRTEPYANKDQDELIAEIVDRLFWYLMVCNRVVYQLQYQDTKVNIIEHEEETKLKTYTLKELDEKLSSIDYNLTTNDGNRIVPEKWIDLFYAIQKTIKELRVDNLEAHIKELSIK